MPENRKKIVLVIPSLNAGGMERVMSELATYFFNHPNVDVHLIMYGIKPEIFYSLPSNLSIHKPDFEFRNEFRTWYSIKTIFYLRKEIIKLNPDSILSFGEYWNSFVLIALYGLKFPVFVSDRGQPDKNLGIFHNTLRKILYPNAKGIIVQTQIAKKIYQRILPTTNIHVIGNPIREISDYTITKRENIVLSVGRLIQSKHHYELIRLFVGLDVPGWKLVIIGDNAIKQQNMAKLMRLVVELGASDKVILTGPRVDVDSFYLKSKIFAFTSSSEGFPNVIGEAQSAGLPVIAFDCIAGPSEMIEDGVNGYLVPLNDYELFQLKLYELIKNTENQKIFGNNALISIKKFDTKIICEKFYKVVLT